MTYLEVVLWLLSSEMRFCPSTEHLTLHLTNVQFLGRTFDQRAESLFRAYLGFKVCLVRD
jgi:hypothetical protein